MRRIIPVLIVVLLGFAVGSTAAVAAPAAPGDVVVFSNEVTPLTVFTDPHGCVKLPLAAHTLTNQLDRPVEVYGDPYCATGNLTVPPGYGAHVVPGSGSFSA